MHNFNSGNGRDTHTYSYFNSFIALVGLVLSFTLKDFMPQYISLKGKLQDVGSLR